MFFYSKYQFCPASDNIKSNKCCWIQVHRKSKANFKKFLRSRSKQIGDKLQGALTIRHSTLDSCKLKEQSIGHTQQTALRIETKILQDNLSNKHA